MSDPNRVLTVKVRNYSIEVRGPALHVGRGGDPAVETFLRPLLIAALYADLHSVKVERTPFACAPFIEVCDCAMGETRRSLMAVREAADAAGFTLTYDYSEPITGA